MLVASSSDVDLDGLYRQHARTVARWATRLGGPSIDAEDVVHDVFVVARRRLVRWEGPAKVTTWLFRTTEKIVLAARRRQRLRHLLFVRDDDELDVACATPRPTPLDVLEREESARHVYRLLDQLSYDQRRALILYEMEGLSTQEIADLVDAPVTTVRVWLHRGRAKFTGLFAASEAVKYEQEAAVDER